MYKYMTPLELGMQAWLWWTCFANQSNENGNWCKLQWSNRYHFFPLNQVLLWTRMQRLSNRNILKKYEKKRNCQKWFCDRVAPKAIEIQEEPEVQIVEPSMEGGTFTDEGEMTVAHAPEPILQSRVSSSLAPVLPMDVPQTPDVGVEAPVTPRHSPTTRTHGIEGDDDHETKRARVEAAKKQRLDRISSECSPMIRAVKISNETYHTMDDYDSELRLDDHAGEVSLGEIPEELWSDCPIDRQPETPEPWIDRLADMVELGRLCGMNVLEEVTAEQLSKEEHLTTKFVCDWRLKGFTSKNGTSCKTWLRRSRLVAREFSFLERSSDTYSPATSTHILNILPTSMIYLQNLGDATSTEQQTGKQSVVLRTVDIKDAFFMFDQGKPMAVSLHNKLYRVKKKVPGQRLGAKMWYRSFRDFLNKHLDMHGKEQPLLRDGSC